MDKNCAESIRNAKAQGLILTGVWFISMPTIDYPDEPYIAFFYHETADEIGWANFDEFCKLAKIPIKQASTENTNLQEIRERQQATKAQAEFKLIKHKD